MKMILTKKSTFEVIYLLKDTPLAEYCLLMINQLTFIAFHQTSVKEKMLDIDGFNEVSVDAIGMEKMIKSKDLISIGNKNIVQSKPNDWSAIITTIEGAKPEMAV